MMKITQILCAVVSCAPVVCAAIGAGELDHRPRPRPAGSESADRAAASVGTHASRVRQPGGRTQVSGADQNQSTGPTHDSQPTKHDPVEPRAPDMTQRVGGSAVGVRPAHQPMSDNAKAVRSLLDTQAGRRLSSQPVPRHGRSSRPETESGVAAGTPGGVGARLGGRRDGSAGGGGAVTVGTGSSAATNVRATGGISAPPAAAVTRQSAQAAAGRTAGGASGLKAVAGNGVAGGPPRAAGSGIIGGAAPGKAVSQAARIDGSGMHRKF
jgi:hypothetical protein